MAKGLLITNKSNIRYLSNFTGSSGFMLKTAKKSFLFTDFRYIQRAKDSIKNGVEVIDSSKLWKDPKTLQGNWAKILEKYKINELAVEESDITLKTYNFFKKSSPKVKLTSGKYEIEKLRAIKTKEEIKLTQKSQSINEKTLTEIKKIIQHFIEDKTQTTEAELAWLIKNIGHGLGAKEVSFDPIVAFGEHSSSPHHEPGDKKLKIKKGTPICILIDMGMKYQGYCSDMTRVFFTEKPSPRQQEIYELVLKSQESALQKIKAGISGTAADSYSRDIIKAAGYGDQYGHAGGHGVGLDIHEMPSLSENYKDKLEENNIITVEPGIYLPGEFGVRIEDMCLVTKDGNKNLTSFPKDLKSITLF